MAVASLAVRLSAQIAEFQKSFADAQRTVKGFERDFSGVASSVSAHQQRMNRAFADFAGDKIIADANALVRAVERVGGATRLTETEQARVNSTLNESINKYKLLGQTAPKAMLDLAAATAKVPEQLTLAQRAGNLLSSTFGQFTAANLAANAIGAVVSRVSDFIARGQQLPAIESSFQKLSASVHQSAEEMRGSLRTATSGLVSDFDLMQSANKAILLGLPVTAQEMGDLAKTATILGRAMGQDATKSLDDLIVALGRSSPLILDNLGLTVKVGEANEAYAAKLGKTVQALTDTEQKQAFYVAAMEKARQKTKELGELQPTLTDFVTRAWTTIANNVTANVSTMNRAIGFAIANAGKFALVTQEIDALGFDEAMKRMDARAKDVATSVAQIGTAAAAAAPKQRDFAVELKRAAETMPVLTAEGRKQYDAAVKLGTSTEELTKLFGLSAIQQQILTDRTKASSEAQKEFGKNVDAMVKRVFAQAAASEQVEKAMAKVMAAMRTDTVDRMTSRLEIQTRQMNATTEGWIELGKAIDSVNAKVKLGLDSAPGFSIDPKALFPEDSLKDAARSAAEGFGRELSQAIIAAVQGGGDIGASIGAVIGEKVGSTLGASLAKTVGSKFGEVLGGMLGPLGAIGGQLLGGLIDKLFNRESVRVNDLRDQFLLQFGGQGTDAGSGFGELARQLAEMGASGEAAFQRLIRASKENDFSAAVVEVTRLLDQQKQKQLEVADATAKASADMKAATDAAAGPLRQRISELTQEFDNLSKAVSAEAAEDEMGVIERQMRDRMAAIAQERTAQESELQKILDGTKSQADAAAEYIEARLNEIKVNPIIVPFEFGSNGNTGMNGGARMNLDTPTAADVGGNFAAAEGTTIEFTQELDGRVLTDTVLRNVGGRVRLRA